MLASSVPRGVINDAIAAAGRQAKRSDGKLPLHVMVYFVLALFAEDDYEEIARGWPDAGLEVLGCPVGGADIKRDHPGTRATGLLSRCGHLRPGRGASG
jgi:hypothetical protein